MENISIQIEEIVTEQDLTPSVAIEQDPVFTRYLYLKHEVETSIKISIFKHDLNRALFWAYELYYSGFEYECFEILSNLYTEYYSEQYPNLGIFLNRLCLEYTDHPDRHWIVATMIRNLIDRESKYIEPPVNPKSNDKKFYIRLYAEDITRFETVDHEKEKARNVLKQVCEYTPYREKECVDYDFETPKPEGVLEKYRYHWLYYASYSPIWKKRIEDYGGVINHKTQNVDFPEEENHDEFHEMYQYEPDEQSKEIQLKNVEW